MSRTADRRNPQARDCLIYTHLTRMVAYMKTTLNIDDTVMERLRREAARRGSTMSELVEAALRLFLARSRRRPAPLPELPSFDGDGGARAWVALGRAANVVCLIYR